MGNPPSLTEEGYEIHIGTNHIGHFLLTKLLLPTLQHTLSRSPDVRVITLGSLAGNSAPSYDVITSTSGLMAHGWSTRYGASKAANALFAAELARRYPEIMSVSVHPGTVGTDLYQHSKQAGPFYNLSVALMLIFIRSPRTGALTQIWAASAPRENLVNGGYYVPIAAKGVSQYEGDVEMAKSLWDWTEREIAKHN
jgi:NAD(P)-dependent dehydrogenase (short-subunit alcohol dehydrogenase family)